MTIFPYVTNEPKILRNDKNSVLFVLFFMTANPSYKAKELASKIAKHILNSKDR